MLSDGQRMTIYIIYDPFGDAMVSHDLQLNVRCHFTYATKTF